MKINLHKLLDDLEACGDGKMYPNVVSVRAAWRECKRGDHMLWLAAKLGIERKTVVVAAVECAASALPHVEGTDAFDPTRDCIEVTTRWAKGDAEVTLRDVRRAAYAADAVADAADAADAAADAADAAYAAAYAADAADAAADAADAAYAAVYAADAADAAAYAAYAAARRGAKATALADMATIVRRHVTGAMIEEAMKARQG